uniref:Uncharacterized protein n=1 Tax=Proboscia inermis TaxID=420281 RepID=A0A7S0BUN6_9STRA|mmetsp:Transcript_1034/g.1067  ORF Transcript_1034/g.1067 Transcript_1034/m.1067 type:complete len:102 (+) Transcript_1034:125-430(+)
METECVFVHMNRRENGVSGHGSGLGGWSSFRNDQIGSHDTGNIIRCLFRVYHKCGFGLPKTTTCWLFDGVPSCQMVGAVCIGAAGNVDDSVVLYIFFSLGW